MSNVLDALIEALEKTSNIYLVVDEVAEKFIAERDRKNLDYDADLIELLELAKQEIKQDYTSCPVDSNGETIHVGDMLSGIGEVYGVSETMVFAGSLIFDDDIEQPLISSYIASGQTKCDAEFTRALIELVQDARGFESRDDAALVAKHIDAIQKAMVGEASNAVG